MHTWVRTLPLYTVTMLAYYELHAVSYIQNSTQYFLLVTDPQTLPVVEPCSLQSFMEFYVCICVSGALLPTYSQQGLVVVDIFGG